MKTVLLALALAGFVAGCASQQSPSANSSQADRPDLRDTSQENKARTGGGY